MASSRPANIDSLAPWSVSFDPRSGYHTHRTSSAVGTSLLAPVVASFFHTLRLGASITNGEFWWVIQHAGSVLDFEAGHGVDAERGAYNLRSMTQARQTRKLVRGTHAGYSDLFVPVCIDDRVVALLIVGPFTLARPTAADILSRFRDLTGKQGHPSDPEFSAYLAMTLDTLLLTPSECAALEDLVQILARMLAGDGPPGELATRAERCHIELWNVRGVERSWEAARDMLDERFPGDWHSLGRKNHLRVLGLSRVPDDVLLGLARVQELSVDPVDEAVRRDAFQRRAVKLARDFGETIAGRVGEHGVAFLSSASGSNERRRQRLEQLSRRVRAVARREYGIDLYCGVSVARANVSLPEAYQFALGAAEAALADGSALVFADSAPKRTAQSLRALREALGQRQQERPGDLSARFDRYVEAVAQSAGHRLDLVRLHLEIGFERLTEPLVSSGALAEKSLGLLRRHLDRASAVARDSRDLFQAYRLAVKDVSESIDSPRSADRERSLRTGIEYLHQHQAEPISRSSVARVAGFAPDYFGRLFKRREGVTFERYLRHLRVERSKQLLAGTELDLRRIAELSGFSNAQYFCHVFKEDLGVTPVEYRRRPRRAKRLAKRRSRLSFKRNQKV